MIDYTRMYGSQTQKGFDVGLREYMLKVYSLMSVALALTGTTAFAIFSFEPLRQLIFNVGPNGEFFGITGFGMLMMFAPLAFGLMFSFTSATMDIEKSKMLFWAYAAVNGVSFASMAFLYTGESIARTFLITSSVFAAMSMYGYSTKKDLTSISSFLMMGLIGIVITSLVNIYFQSPAVQFATSFIGVFIFMGLTAWDTQKLKNVYFSSGGGEMGQRMAIVGAFSLYLDFVNMFIYLLRLFGTRRSND